MLMKSQSQSVVNSVSINVGLERSEVRNVGRGGGQTNYYNIASRRTSTLRIGAFLKPSKSQGKGGEALGNKFWAIRFGAQRKVTTFFSSARIRTFVDNIKGPKVVKSVSHFQVKTVFYMLNTFLAIYALAWTYRYNLISSIQCLNRQNTESLPMGRCLLV
ncbi:hypothetical protein EV421DRAFT_2022989 [Armillaria borealis]|uniref:Uncharacterized protein n=1 Tax=Armillaria borealis TaxID=47425 RepID=A0AA39J2U6_9AGAR|nr:hypothetical protein EV421DRAFT_2022989 [Armillaria borealis]